MAKNVTWTTNFGTLAYAYIARPDDKAPDGAKFQPDGKYKGTLVFDSEADIAQLRADCIAALRAEFPSAPRDDDQLALPIKAGESLSGKKAESFAGKFVVEAKSQYQPKVYDSLGQLCPPGVYAASGDVVRFKVSPYAFKKTEKVREKGKMVDVDMFGVSLRLVSAQIKKKGAGGSDGGFDAVDDGDFDGSTAERREEPSEPRSAPRSGGGGDGDF